MSTALGIASVTHVLKDLLNDGLINHDVMGIVNSNVQVTALPPDRIETGPNTEQTGLNLFLYQTRLNPGWRNEGQLAFDGQGQRINNPPLALDLHYFLTAYGAEELHAEILMGYGMQLLHETPVLTRDAIRLSLSAPPVVAPAGLPPALRALATSALAEQVEQIKISPESLGAEEMSRLWTAFQAKYRLTAGYKVTVVLIQREKSTRSALPVASRMVSVQPFRQPVIDRIESQADDAAPIMANQKILTGHRLIVFGQQLADDLVNVTIDGTTMVTEPVTDSQIRLIVPDTVLSGAHALQVVHQRLLGKPPVPHRADSSNVAAFVLSPTVPTAVGAVVFTPGAVNAGGVWEDKLMVPVKPGIGPGQRAVVLLNEVTGGVGKAYSFVAPTIPLNTPVAPAVTFPVQQIKPGTYLVRIQVDGAESSLTINSVTDPKTGKPTRIYTDPKVIIP